MARTGLSNTSVSGHTNEITPLNVPITRVERIQSKVSEQWQRNQTLLNFAPGLVLLNVGQHEHLNIVVLDNFSIDLLDLQPAAHPDCSRSNLLHWPRGGVRTIPACNAVRK